jgi:hypothetical protein
VNRGIPLPDFQPGPNGDWAPAFAAAFAALADCTHATVHIPDGDFGVLQPVDAPFQRFESCMVQQGQKSVRHKGERIAIRLTPRGTHCCFSGTFINPAENALFAQAFDGSLEACTVVGTLYNRHVPCELQVNQFASGTGGAAWQPVVGFAGQGVRLAEACTEPPRPEEGEAGEVRWMAGDGAATLYLKTPQGWTRCRMEAV